MPAPTTVAEVGKPPTAGEAILVAVGNPNHVEQLLRTAADLALQEEGSVHVVSVVAKAHDSPFGVFDDETIGEEFSGDSHAVLERAVDTGRRLGVDVSGRVVVDRSVSHGVVATADAIDADAVLVGWSGLTHSSDVVLGTNVDAIIERAPQDVYVERTGTVANGVDRVLIPVAGGPHATLAAEAGYAIATANGAQLTLLSVAADGTDRSTARERIQTTLDELGVATAPVDGRGAMTDPNGRSEVAIETTVSTNDDVVHAITAAAVDHDVVLLGATRSGHHKARLVGSIPHRVADRTDRTIVLARRWTGQSRLTRVLTRISWS